MSSTKGTKLPPIAGAAKAKAAAKVEVKASEGPPSDSGPGAAGGSST